MSTPEPSHSPTGQDGDSSGHNNAPTPSRGKFNVTRTSKIAYAGAPLVGEAGRSPASHSFGSSPPEAPLESAGGGPLRSQGRPLASPAGTPPLPPQRPPNVTGNGVSNASSSSSRGPTPPTRGTPPLAPRSTPVPLITPRYQKKSRTNRAMDLTDSFTDRSANVNELRRQHATENLTVTNGPQQYQQEVHFHTYEMYRHGRRQIHSRSVGYSSDGDLVMTREDYSEASDVDNSVTRVHTEISNPTVLNAAARRPLTDSELASKKKLHMRRPRYKKYPGILAPRNKKLRNRLMNDYFVNEQAMQLLNAARERREGGADDVPQPKPSFQDLPPAVLKAFDLTDDAQERELERLGATRSPHMTHVQPPRDPDSAESRFQALNLRLRGELQHALSSEFLSRQIEDLEVCFSEFIARGPTEESLVFHFRDGYGRLVCHGVAGYYQLVSESRQSADGATKLTHVCFPKSKKAGIRALRLPHAPLTHVLRGNKSNVPARHPLSTNVTPVQAPQPSPSRAAQAIPDLGAGGQDAGAMRELEPMSPLDLNAAGEFSVPPPLAGTVGKSGAQEKAPADEEEAGSPGDPSRTIVSSASGSTVHGGEEAGHNEGQRQALVNPTAVMTVNGKLSTPEVPVYAPHLRLMQLAFTVEHGGGGGGDGHEVSEPSSASSNSSSDEDDDEENW